MALPPLGAETRRDEAGPLRVLTGQRMRRRAGQGVRARGAGGFSLFEVVLVVAIIGLLAGVAIPRFAGSDARYRLDAAERRVLADVGLIAERARATGAAHEIEFDVADEVYRMYVGTGAGRTLYALTPLARAPYRAEIDSVEISGNGATLAFNGSGQAMAASSIVLRVGAGTRAVVLSGDPPPGATIGVGDIDIGDLPVGIADGFSQQGDVVILNLE